MDPAIWRYCFKTHFQQKHWNAPFTEYQHIWMLMNFEIVEMKKIWAEQAKAMVKRSKKSKLQPLTISEDHWAQIPERYCQDFNFSCHRGSWIFELNFSDENPASHEEDLALTSETEPDHQHLPANDESKGNEDTGNEDTGNKDTGNKDEGKDGWSDKDEFGGEDEYLISWKQAGRGTL
jgi:hypothetical protein